MPSRVLREGILTSERVDALASWSSECFYRRLMSVVDDFGRYYANPSLVRAACFPLKLDTVSNADIETWLADCAAVGLVEVYEVRGKRYLHMQDFRQQQRATASKFPPQPGECVTGASQAPTSCDPPYTVAQQPCTDAHLVEGVVEDEGESPPRKRASASARKAPMPKDFAVSGRVREWAKSKGFTKLDEHLESFISKARANGYKYLDWDEAFMNAIRDDWAKLRNGSRKPSRGEFEGVA